MNSNVSQKKGSKGKNMLLVILSIGAVLSVVFCVLALTTELFMPDTGPDAALVLYLLTYCQSSGNYDENTFCNNLHAISMQIIYSSLDNEVLHVRSYVEIIIQTKAYMYIHLSILILRDSFSKSLIITTKIV